MSLRAVSRSRFGTTIAVAFWLSIPFACVNRGQHAPEDDAAALHAAPDARGDRTGAGGWASDAAVGAGGAGGASGVDARGDITGAAGRGGAGAGAGGAGGGGVGGSIGAGGATASGGRGGGGSGASGAGIDAGPGDVGSVCSARFNFENGNLYGASINGGFQTAFSNLRHATDAACGAGSLKVDVALSPSSAKGELVLPLGTTESLAGKTVSLAVKMTPQESPNAYVIVFAVPSYTFITAFSPIPATWSSSKVTLAADAGATATTAISVQVIGQGDSYAGALLIDEIDVR